MIWDHPRRGHVTPNFREGRSGGEALEILRRPDQRVDLMLIDFAMPGMNGVETAQRAATIRHYLPILLATGYADAAGLSGEAGSSTSPSVEPISAPRLPTPWRRRGARARRRRRCPSFRPRWQRKCNLRRVVCACARPASAYPRARSGAGE